MQAFKLSKYFSTSQIAEEIAVPDKFKQGHFLLSDHARDRDFIINATVKYFIDKFHQPKTFDELINEVSEDLKSSAAELQQTCSTFFDFLCEKNVLIAAEIMEDENEAPIKPLLNEGDVFENFTIEKLLSDRGTLEVYLAKDNFTGFESVIKLLNSNKTYEKAHYDEELNELQREFDMLKDIEHIPIMCKAFGFTRQEFYAYIHLEHIKGISLSRFLKTGEDISISDCKKIILAFLEGFGAMHKNGIIHGDIHASNILVEDANHVRIIDFGYSRKSNVETNEVLPFGGVMHYMPPERINVSSLQKFAFDANLSSDVYQVGVLMYLTFYRTLPFDGFVWEELAKNIKETEPNYSELSFFNEPVSFSIINIIKKCLHKEPAKRYLNAGGILNDFLKYAFEKEPIAN